MLTSKCAREWLFAILALLLAIGAGIHSNATQASGRKVFTESIVPLPEPPDDHSEIVHGLVVNKSTNANKRESMDVLFVVGLSSDAAKRLEAVVAKGETLSPDEIKALSPSAADTTKVSDWLTANGFKITRMAPNNSGIYVKAAVMDIESALQVRMVRVLSGGLPFNAAATAPSLPSEVGNNVTAIIGLQPFRQANRHNKKFPKTGPANQAKGLVPQIANSPPYLVNEILKAYDAVGSQSPKGTLLTGKGQTIGILIDTFPKDSDHKAFWTRNGLPTNIKQVQKINVQNVAALPDREGEETMDAQWTSGIAPGANINIYAAGSLAFVDLNAAIDRMISDAMADKSLKQVSISLGLGEAYMPKDVVTTQHQKFLTLAGLGVNCFISTGDAGSNPNVDGHSVGKTTTAEYESTDTCVVAVGGTKLVLRANGALSTEEAWGLSGGGISSFFDRPTWQVNAGLSANNKRVVPDVSLVAAPETGALVIFDGADNTIGGTSLSAPIWAGFCALINESRVEGGGSALGFVNPRLYDGKNSACFRDITVGSNGVYSAGKGHDMVTGLGVPIMSALVRNLSK